MALSAIGLASGCGGPAAADLDASADGGAEAAPRPIEVCTTSPATEWSSSWDTVITDKDVSPQMLVATGAGDRIAVATSWKLGGNLSLEEYDGGGALLWAVSLGALVHGRMNAAFGSAGDLYVAIAGQVQTSSGILSSPGDPLSGGSLLKVDANGALAWGVPLVAAAQAQPTFEAYNAGLKESAVTIDGAGDVWVAETVFVPDASRANTIRSLKVVLEKHDPTDGHLLFQNTFESMGGGSSYDPPSEIFLAPAPNGGIAMAGSVWGTIDLGGGPLVPLLDDHAPGALFVAQFDARGAHLWSATFGGRQGVEPSGLAFDPQGDVVVAGRFSGLIDLGGMLFGSHGQIDALLARLAPTGAPLWGLSVGDPGNNWFGRPFVDAKGTVRLQAINLQLTLGDGSELDASGFEALLAIDDAGAVRAARCLPGYVPIMTVDDAGDVFAILGGTSLTSTRLVRLPAF
jgi:hypothetical protein